MSYYYPFGETVYPLVQHTQRLQLGSIASADAPHIAYRIKFQGLDALLVGVYHAAVPITLILLGKVRGHLCQRLIGSQTDADRHSHILFDFLVQVLTPLLQILMLHAVKIDEAFVNRIAEIGWHLLTDQAHNAASQFSI